MQKIKTELLVIGSGIAGLTVAINAGDDVQVLLCTKGLLKDTNTGMAQGGIAVVMDIEDKPLYHYEDTMYAGGGLCLPEAVSVLVNEGPERVKELIALGANFDKNKNDYSLTQEGAHQKRRILHAGDSTGLEIERALLSALRDHPRIKVREKVFIKELVVKDNRCYGAVGIDVESGELLIIEAGAVAICTGGLGQVYEKNTNPPMATGDGTAFAYRAGAAICDMEFVQFHPTTLVTGDRKPVSLFLISEAVRGEGAHLLNANGERFMPSYHRLAELAPRDVVAKAIVEEMRKTGVNHVFLDFTQIEEDIQQRFPTITKRCLEQGYDITKELIPVAPAAHYSMGGIKTDIDGRTSVTGLYAAGEVSSVGVHGANRLASNSLLDGLVFGSRAARSAVSYVRDLKLLPVKYKDLSTDQDMSVNEISETREKIRSLMWNYVGIIRSENGLLTAKKALLTIASKISFRSNRYEICELQNLLQNALLITIFALERKESRGSHYRDDHPETLPQWRKRLETTRKL